MNPILKKEFQKCSFQLPEYNDTTTYLYIPKQVNNQVLSKEMSLEKDHYYIIKLQYYIINPPDNFSLSSNWNKGVNPKSEFLFGTPTKFVGKMIQWDACGYDYANRQPKDDVYNELWLPQKGFEILEEVNN